MTVKFQRSALGIFLVATGIYFLAFIFQIQTQTSHSSKPFYQQIPTDTELDFDYISVDRFNGYNLSSFHERTAQLTFSVQMEVIKSQLAKLCPPGTNETSSRCYPLTKRPWLVFGTAGTGTRVIHDILGYLGVKMSQLTNKQRDSRIFIELVKKSDFFSSMPSNIPPLFNSSSLLQPYSNGTIVDWIARNGMNYKLNDLDTSTQESVIQTMDNIHKIISQELYSRFIDADIDWGFKEPQLMFVLPFINQYYSATFRNLSEYQIRSRVKLVHVVRDGRDIAFSKQHLRKYQQLYTLAFYQALPPLNLESLLKHSISLAFSDKSCIRNVTGDNECIFPQSDKEYYEAFNVNGIPQEWLFRIRVSRVWAAVNVMVKKYILASAKSAVYIPIKLEEICDRDSAFTSLSRVVSEGKLDADPEFFDAFVETLEFDKCRLKKYLTADPVLVFMLEGASYQGLQTFNYPLLGSGWPSVLNTSITSKSKRMNLNSLLSDLPSEIEATHDDKVSIFVFTTRTYVLMMVNWLKAAQLTITVEDNQIVYIIIATSDDAVYDAMMGKDVSFDDPILHSLQENFALIVGEFSSSIIVVPHLITIQSLSGQEELAHADIWGYRIKAALTLLRAGHTVVLSDTDALFTSSPLDLLKLPHDVISSRGRFPYALASKWGAAACMGWISFKIKAFGILEQMHDLMETMSDDQVVLNSVLDSLGVTWTSVVHLVEGKEISLLETNTKLGKVALLDYSTIPRFCSDDLAEHGIGKNDPVGSFWFNDIYPDARVLHCYTPKDGRTKKDWFVSRKLWFIDSL